MKVTIEFTRPGRPRRRWAVLALALALALPATVFAASTYFNDVAADSPYREGIDALAGAGVTTGCGASLFCPTANITRQQEAVLIHRGGPRIAMSTSLLDSSVTNGAANDVAAVTIKVGGSTALTINANQFVRVDGRVTLAGTAAGCPCTYAAYIVDEANGTYGPAYQIISANVSTQDSIATSWVFPAGPGEHTYRLRVYYTGTTALTFYNPVVIAQTATFGSEGGDVLAGGPFKSVKKDKTMSVPE